MEIMLFCVGAVAAYAVVSNYRCHFFGHTPGRGYYKIEGDGYLEIKRGAVDGIDREHAALYSECACCGKRFKVGNLHIQPDGRLFQQAGRG